LEVQGSVCVTFWRNRVIKGFGAGQERNYDGEDDENMERDGRPLRAAVGDKAKS